MMAGWGLYVLYDLCGTAVAHVFADWDLYNTALAQHIVTANTSKIGSRVYS